MLQQKYTDKFESISLREQVLILITSLVVIIFVTFNFFIERNFTGIGHFNKQITQYTSSIKSMKSNILLMQEGLNQNKNDAITKQIDQYETKLAKVDSELLELTSGLINPIQMRYALIELLKVQKGVSLVSFELLPVQPLLSSNKTEQSAFQAQSQKEADGNISIDENLLVNTSEQASFNLYRHGIKIKLTGKYFQLRDYLTQLENLSWKFFWQKFNYNLQEYPVSELEIEMYSLSTEREFIGV